jgi:molybdate ABC transporter, permease protein
MVDDEIRHGGDCVFYDLRGLDFSPLLISIRAAILATIVTFFFGIAAASFVSGYRGKFKGLIDGVLTLPLVLPPTVVGFLLLLMFGKNGPFGKLLLAIGMTVIFSWPATVIAASVVAFPLMYRTVRSAFEQIDPTIIYAARTLSVSEWRIFWKIMIPLAWPGVAAGTVLAFARALGDFGATLMIGGNIPGQTLTIPAAIFFAAEGGEMRKASLWVIFIFIISLVVMTLMNYWADYQRKIIAGSGRE